MRQLNATIVVSTVVCLGLLPTGTRSVRSAPTQLVVPPSSTAAASSESPISDDSNRVSKTPRSAESIWKSGYQLVEYLSGSSRSQRTPDLKIAKLEDGSSASDTRSQAITALPLENLTGKDRARVTDVLDRLTLFRRLPTISLEIEPIMYRFFAQNPHVAVSIWRAMGISTFQMRQQNANSYTAQSNDGTSGVIDVLYCTSQHNNSECLAICDGWYRPLLPLKPIKAIAILHLESSYTNRADGTPLVAHRVDMFVSFPSQTIASASRIVSPITNPIIDRNFIEISRFMKMMSTAMALRPGWVEMIGNQMDGVVPARKKQFLEVAARVYVRTRQRNRRQAMQPSRRPRSSSDKSTPDATPRRSGNQGRTSARPAPQFPSSRPAVKEPTTAN